MSMYIAMPCHDAAQISSLIENEYKLNRRRAGIEANNALTMRGSSLSGNGRQVRHSQVVGNNRI